MVTPKAGAASNADRVRMVVVAVRDFIDKCVGLFVVWYSILAQHPCRDISYNVVLNYLSIAPIGT